MLQQQSLFLSMGSVVTMESSFNCSWQQQPSCSNVCRIRTTYSIVLCDRRYLRLLLAILQQSLSFSVSRIESTVSTLGVKSGLHLSPQRCYKHFGHHASLRPATAQAAGEGPCTSIYNDGAVIVAKLCTVCVSRRKDARAFSPHRCIRPVAGRPYTLLVGAPLAATTPCEHARATTLTFGQYLSCPDPTRPQS